MLLASQAIALFRVDRPWSQSNLLPLFNWAIDSGEASAAWEGFLWSPRLYRPLLVALQAEFFDTAKHYTELRESAEQFAAFLTFAGLDLVEAFTLDQFQTAFEALPQEGLDEAAHALAQSLEGAGDQVEEYLANRIQPFWQRIWPKSRGIASNSIAHSLARLSVAAGGQFPAALTAVFDWLRPIEDPYFVIHLLHESDLSVRFPGDALRLLDAIIDDQPWASPELTHCLTAILEAAPALAKDHRYVRLSVYVRQRSSLL